jgi:hypothetical protein
VLYKDFFRKWRLIMAKKKATRKNIPLRTDWKVTQQKRDRLASTLAIALGLLSIREGGAVLLGLTVPDYHVLPWLVWYNVIMGVVSVAAGAGMWQQQDRSVALAVNILVIHGIVFVSLFAMYQLGQVVAARSIYAMLFRTFAWIVIYSLLRWRREDG